MVELRNATLAARQRTGDKTIATNIKKGLVQVVRVVYNGKGTSTVTPVSNKITEAEAIALLNEMV